MRPLAIDLFCGLGGWTEGLLAEGYDVIGFDIERHEYGAHRYPAQLVIQDVLTLHGSQFRGAALIVASPPCQEYSYMAMPWKLAKAKAAAIRADVSGADLERLNRLFNACFRIQHEARDAAGRHIPMVVENVRGAIPWVGRSRWNFGSFHLWGDVPALMPTIAPRAILKPQPYDRRHGTGSWFAIDMKSARAGTIDPREIGQKAPGFRFDGSGRSFQSASVEGVKQRGSGAALWDKALDERRKEATAIKNGGDWFSAGADCSEQRRHGSRSSGRKFASAMIAKIPLPLSRHIAAVYKETAQSPGRERAAE